MTGSEKDYWSRAVNKVQLWRKLPNTLSRFIFLVWYSLLASSLSAKVTSIRVSVKARVAHKSDEGGS